MKIVLITRDRPQLTKQTIETMKANAANWDQHELFVVFDDHLTPENKIAIEKYLGVEVHPTGSQLGVGGAKNFGVECLEHYNDGLADDEIIMFSDNDMYYLPNWDIPLIAALEFSDITQLGGWKHPFHQYSSKWVARTNVLSTDKITDNTTYLYKYREVDACTGNCFVIKFSDWKKYGPFDSNAVGPGQSEDYALSQRIKAGGGIVATLSPPVAIHCGLANCLGEPATGYEEMSKMVDEQLAENNIESIWLSTPEEGTILIERSKLPDNTAFVGLNVGSGQRRFSNIYGWLNIDSVTRPPDQVPDVVCDATKLDTRFEENSQDMVVLHHVLEHFGCGEANEVLKQCYKVLSPGGSLLIFVPDLRKLAGRWLAGELDDFSYMVNLYGAYQGLEGDRHKWGYDLNSLKDYIVKTLFEGDYRQQVRIKEFDWRDVPGADFGRDWWVLALEITK